MEPKNRLRRPSVRGWFRCRMTISPTMPIRVSQEKMSAHHSNTIQCPMIGSAKVGTNSCPYAVATNELSVMKPIITNQCRTPTRCHCSIRVCPRVSVTSPFHRSPRRSLRPTAGRPSRITASIERMARTARTTATAVIASETTIATTCTVLGSSVRALARGVVLLVNLNPTRQ